MQERMRLLVNFKEDGFMVNKISDERADQLRKEVLESLDKLAKLEVDLKREEVKYIITKRA